VFSNAVEVFGQKLKSSEVDRWQIVQNVSQPQQACIDIKDATGIYHRLVKLWTDGHKHSALELGSGAI